MRRMIIAACLVATAASGIGLTASWGVSASPAHVASGCCWPEGPSH